MEDLENLKDYLYNVICGYEMEESNRDGLIDTMLAFINEFYYCI